LGVEQAPYRFVHFTMAWPAPEPCTVAEILQSPERQAGSGALRRVKRAHEVRPGLRP
jgi:hypothetical protein